MAWKPNENQEALFWLLGLLAFLVGYWVLIKQIHAAYS